MPRDAGFTLVELLIALTISTMVFALTATSFVVAQQSTAESTTRLLESQDGAYTSAWFVKDVQSAASIGSGSICGASGTPLLALEWAEVLTSGTTTYKVEYSFSAGKLVRTACSPVTDVQTLATNLTSLPSLTCNPSCATPDLVRLRMETHGGGVFAYTAARRRA